MLALYPALQLNALNFLEIVLVIVRSPDEENETFYFVHNNLIYKSFKSTW